MVLFSLPALTLNDARATTDGFTSDPNCVPDQLVSQVDEPVPGQPSETATVYTYADSEGDQTTQVRPDDADSFSPLTASPETLTFYDYPARPSGDDPDALQNWETNASAFKFFEPPGICEDHTVGNVQWSYNWSGSEDNDSSTFNDIYGNIHAPTLSGGCSGSETSEWVGIGGDGSSAGKHKLLQNGIIMTASPDNSWHYFWEAIDPSSGDTGTDIVAGTVSPGDLISVQTFYDTSYSFGKVYFNWDNLTTGGSNGIAKTVIQGDDAVDYYNPNYAEAILERPYNYNTSSWFPLRRWTSGDAEFSGVHTTNISNTLLIRDRVHANFSMEDTSGLDLADWTGASGQGQLFVHYNDCS
jgi:hypothetical protein